MRYSIILFLFLSSFVAMVSAQVCPYQEALESFRNQNYQAAVDDLSRIVADPLLCPDMNAEDAHYWRAWCYYKRDNIQAALADFRLAESSVDNGATAQYMRLYIQRAQNPQDIELLKQSVVELNTLITRFNIPPSLKDRALLFRNILRLQIGEQLYNTNQFDLAQSYFEGIRRDEDPINANNMGDINALINASASAWLLHINLTLGKDVDESFIAKMLEIPLTISESEPELAAYSMYFQSLLPLLAHLKLNDYDYFVAARDAMRLLDKDLDFVPDFRATFNLLESEYTAVINSDITTSPFANYRMGWAHLLRNVERNDVNRAATFFNSAKNALRPCQTALRKAGAFRYLQAKHLTNFQTDEFVETTLNTYFSNECISEQEYIDHKNTWVAMYREGYGFGGPSCITAQGYLDFGLYKGSAAHVERGKSQLRSQNCPGINTDLERAIYLCIGDNPDFQLAIEILDSALKNPGDQADEIKYALAMAHYNVGDEENLKTALGLLHDLARRGSLDACYKAASIQYALNNNSEACRYLTTIQQRPNEYTIYRRDAETLYNLSGCGALGTAALKIPAQSDITLINRDDHIFAYDYIGTGIGIRTKLFSEMKSEIVKIIKPDVRMDLYDLELLIPPTELTAYIHLTVTSPLGTTPELRIRLNDEEIDAKLQVDGNSYVFDSGPLDIGDFHIVVNQKGSFGWVYDNFVSGRYTATVALDSAFALKKTDTPAQLRGMPSFSHALFTRSGITAFSPQQLYHAGQLYTLPDMGVVTSVAAVGETFYCLVSAESKVVKLTPAAPEQVTDELFIRGVYDVSTDIDAYRAGLNKPLKMLHNPVANTFYILNSDGTIYEFNPQGHCIAAIPKTNDASFFMDMLYDAREHCLWLLDLGADTIHKYDIATKSMDRFARKHLDPTVKPLSFMVDASYFYLATLIGDVHLHKKGNFRRLAVFAMDDKDDQTLYSNFNLIGDTISSKKILAIRKQSDPAAIRPKETLKVLGSAFDGGFEVGE